MMQDICRFGEDIECFSAQRFNQVTKWCGFNLSEGIQFLRTHSTSQDTNRVLFHDGMVETPFNGVARHSSAGFISSVGTFNLVDGGEMVCGMSGRRDVVNL